ncbi:MAG: alpha/beta fold hydrolase [Candidatus Limnocylindrales bacterium]
MTGRPAATTRRMGADGLDPVQPPREGPARGALKTGQTGPDAGAPARNPWIAVGPREAPAIVFIHGTRLSRNQWLPQLRRLSGRYRCIAVDLPGHGLRGDEPFTLEAATTAVVQAIDAETPHRRAFLVGLSLGGYVAVETAEAYPDRVTGLVLAGCSAEPVGPVTMPFRGFAWLMEHVPAPGLRLLNLAFFRTRYRRAMAQPIVDGGFWADGGSTALRLLVGRRYLQRLARLWTPITIINGTFDPVFGPGGDAWAAAARRGHHVLIPWALHLSNLDRPTTFSRAVADAVEDAATHPSAVS